MNINDYYRNKTILITGAASGIGKRFAEKISAVPETTLILWDRNPDFLTTIKQELEKHADVHIAGVDISDPAHIQLEAQRIIKQNLLPDIIINSAGIVFGKMFHEHTFSDIETTMQINATGSMWVTNAFLNDMMQRGSGHIVNMASASGYIGNPRMSVYAASKWAMIGWTDSLQIEMKKLNTGIRVTAVIPSYINTGMFEGVKAPLLTPILETDDIVDRMISGIAKGKNTIQAPYIVRLVPFIKSILPRPVFDWLADHVLGVYQSMDTFKGRAKNSTEADSS
jgi:all-trans-retinol dehydrogenase (NAD+)